MSGTYQRIKRRREAEGLNANAGFTLIELLIVIVVLGILAGVVIFALGGITGKSAVAACQADGATVSTAISAFNAQNSGTTVTQALLLGSTDGGPYVQSWPSNFPHYAFAISDGTTAYGSIAAGTLVVATTPAGNVPSPPASSAWAAYTDPTSCSTVK
ncbi:MAG TPA: prepilin-type N-terminal cleavage/methylation domain-containing protein [Acidimicrobiales bacterium]|nr:prepilin-type N-terminal cleavage/methylation domain-containing protein [Acidimicrobiales bacterium]